MKLLWKITLVQFNSVAQSCLTLCDPMDYSMPGFPVHHQLLELTQTHIHHVGDAIQPSHPQHNKHPFNTHVPVIKSWMVFLDSLYSCDNCATIIYSIWTPYLYGKWRKSKENGLEKFLSRLGRSICQLLSHFSSSMSIYLQINFKGE